MGTDGNYEPSAGYVKIMDEKIYEELVDEPNVDMVIIKDQLPENKEFERMMWKFAVEQLHKEAQLLDL